MPRQDVDIIVEGSCEYPDVTSMSQTLIAASEEDFDVLCDICLNKQKRAKAAGHCIECSETLCGSCCKIHQTSTASKGHVIHNTSILSHSLKTENDSEDCLISGIIVLPDGSLALADFDNMAVKKVDVTNHKNIEHIKLEANPIDITLMKENKAAVTVKGQQYVQVISVSPALSKCHTIALPGFYRGVQYLSNKLFLVCVYPIQGVHICDMSGILLRQVTTDYDGNKLFTWPSRIAMSPNHDKLYITEYVGHTVVSLTVDGALISKYEDKRLNHPCGIVADDNGGVYVCSSNDYTIHRLSDDGKFVRILLEQKDGIKFPYATAHRDGHLYISSRSVGSAYCNRVRVYSLGK